MKKTQPKYPLAQCVEVEWRDSHSRGRWGTVDDYKRDVRIGPIRSIGYVLNLDDDVVQLAQTQSSVNGDVLDSITIPREAVRKIRRVDLKR